MAGRRDLGLLLLRIGTGCTLAAHGLPKLVGGPGREPPSWLARLMGSNYAGGWAASGPEQFAKVLERMEVPLPEVGARASGWAELGGGLALALGLATPLASAVVLGNMAVAIRAAHWKVGFYGQGGYEFPLALATAAASLAITGPGRISADALLAG
ncbi:MAG: DoxX family protein [Candidatus Dormibacteria bacterium]